jgi:toluene monooxygenase electron transfer component
MARITIAGSDITFECGDDDTIMRAAARAGLGFPYECNVGSCGNCRFELQDGEVRHLRENPPGWSAERDAKRRRFLGCQARPLGDCRVKVTLRPTYQGAHPPLRRPAVLTGTTDLTHDIREFRFRLDEPAPFLPGQYALLHLDGVDGDRAYSMSNLPGTGEWHFQIRRVPGGAATTKLFDGMEEGSSLTIDGPYGMAYLRADSPRDILCLGGGSGLSPMMSVARGAAALPDADRRRIHVLYGGRTPRDICGESLLAALPGFGERIHYKAAVSDPGSDGGAAWDGPTGFIHDLAEREFGDTLANMEIYFAGPPPMAMAVQKMLVEHKVPPGQIHFDQYF